MESEDAYFFIRKFEEVYLMMRIPQLGDDAVRLRFIPFSLKDLAKKWLYSLVVDSITTWEDFIKVFLKKFYPIHKIALIRKTSCNSSKNLTSLFGDTLNDSNISWHNVLTTV